MQEKNFFETYKLNDLDLYILCMCDTLRIKAKSASIDVTNGVGGVNPQTTLTIF